MRVLHSVFRFHAIYGIVLGIVILLIGAGGNFLIGGLRNENYYGVRESTVALGAAVAFLVEGILLLVYSIILLKSLSGNQTVRVFKTIKAGCLISIYVQLLEQFVILFCLVVLLVKRDEYFVPLYMLIGGLVGDILALLLSVLVLYAVYKVKPGIITFYIYTLFFLIICWSVFTGFLLGFWHFLLVLILRWLISIVWLSYCLELFTLHLSIMTISLPSKNQLQHLDV